MLSRSFLLFTAVCWLSPHTTFAADPKAGATLYKMQCARCHGGQGEGTKKYTQKLEGDRSVAQLATYVQETMPENDPGSLTIEQARDIAAFMHESFYSPLARERNRPPRIQLARLTVNQYRQSLADVVGGFRWQPNWGTQRGLKGEYFKNRRFNMGDRVVERIDPQVAFDFDTKAPVDQGIEPHEFSIRWNGSILAPETGEYTFTVRTEHATRLWINDTRNPLVDAWVKSGNDIEYSETIYLVGGRIYPLRLEYSKAKQGVDDSKKGEKPPSAKSSITLMWKTPTGVKMPVPSAQLSTSPAPEVFVCTTPFPPDDRSLGWERGTSISKEWDSATTDAAIETANYVATRWRDLAGIKGDVKDGLEAKARAFVLAFAERAYRRPLSAEQKTLIERQFPAGTPIEIGIKRGVILALKSPRFLYREVGDQPDAYDTAARLSFGLWDSIPDANLLKAAAGQQLQTREQVAAHARRMLEDPRGRAKLNRFMLNWLQADQAHDLSKDMKKFPGFEPPVMADLKLSLERFLNEVVWSPTADFRQLLVSEDIYLNDRLGKFYGVKEPLGSDFRKVVLDPGRRAGVLTHPYVLAHFAYHKESSPIHRGVFLARGMLGIGLRPPAEAVEPLSPDLHPSLTTRERVTMQTRPAACIGCHSIINPLGFTLEHYDAVGRFRERDNQKIVDAMGSYLTRDGKTQKLNGARELGNFLANSPEAHVAFSEQMFHYMVQQPTRAYGPDTLESLRKTFTTKQFHIRELAIEVMTIATLKPRPMDATTPMTSQR